MNRVGRFVRSALVLYSLVLITMYVFERQFVFQPAKYPAGFWHPVGLEYEDTEFFAADGTRLHGWLLEHPTPRAHILFLHGTGGNITHNAEQAYRLRKNLQVSVLLFDYRGYGRSEGTPDEAGILQDARAARAWLAKRAEIEEQEIVLLGRSLGGAVAVDLAAADGAAGLILQDTFTSLPDAAASLYPWLPTRLLMRTRLNSLQKIVRYKGPLLASHSTADMIVPYDSGVRLYEASPVEDKKFVAFDHRGHNDRHPEWYFEELDLFLGRVNGAELDSSF